MFSLEHFIGMVVMLAIILPIIFKKNVLSIIKNFNPSKRCLSLCYPFFICDIKTEHLFPTLYF